MILIHPPVAKSCEPPAGIARLCGALDHHGVRYRAMDANLEGLLSLLKNPPVSLDTWTSRALRHLSGHLISLNSWDAYRNEDRYRRAIKDLNRLLEISARCSRVRLGLANYQHEELSPARSTDLVRAAENPEDNPFFPYFQKRLMELIESEQPSVIGLSLNYLSQALSTFAMIGFLRRVYPGVKLVLGGGLVTSWMRRPHWQNPFEGLVDHLVAGPGEVPLLSLMGVREAGDIPYAPSYDSFPLKDYFAPGPILPYSASSGCYWNRCSFCPERAEGNPYLAIPVEEVISDLLRLADRHQPVLIHLLDNAISPSLMKAISEHPPGVPWYGFVRITCHLTDPDFCLALKRSGCVMLKLGLESGDQAVLDDLQKGIDLEEASSALKNLKNAGIAAYVYLLFGTPAEALTEARRTLAFVVKHHDCIGFLNLAIFNMPIYGTEAQQMEKKTFYEGDLSLYASFDHPKGWSRHLIRQFLDKEFKRHPAIASILRRDPPVFTSNHAPFFCDGFQIPNPT
ncbi:MAG: radical SAM protein [Thermodesulfobacteriota bacterium]|nr:radical SAM protein [Thermodesulfobacteriota bacterium]